MNKKILSSTVKVSIILFIIKLLGVIKQSIIASIGGTTLETDAYFIATGVVSAFCVVFFSAISITLLSMYSECLVDFGQDEANGLITASIYILVPVAAVLSTVFASFSKIVAKILAPSYTGAQLSTLASYLEIMAVMFVFTCYYLIINVTLEANKQFLPGKFQSLFQNLFVIIAALTLYEKIGVQVLLYAFLLAGVVQCIQITWNARKIFKIRPCSKRNFQSVKQLLTIAFPLIAGNAIYEINDIVDKQISSGLGEGSVSVLSYGASINEIVTTLIVSSVTTVLFSHYATWAAEGKKHEIENNLKQSMKYLLLFILPVMIVCLVCGDYIIRVLYGRGSFDDASVRRTSGVVIGYTIGFFFQAARANIVKVYYAFQDTKTPMKNGAIAVATNVTLSLVLSRFLGIAGIALSTSLAMILVTLLLINDIKKFFPEFSLKSEYKEYCKMLIAAIFVSTLAFVVKKLLPIHYFGSLVIIGCFVVAFYTLLCFIFNVRSARHMLVLMFHQVRKK